MILSWTRVGEPDVVIVLPIPLESVNDGPTNVNSWVPLILVSGDAGGLNPFKSYTVVPVTILKFDTVTSPWNSVHPFVHVLVPL